MEEYRVLYDFEAEEAGEISVRAGEILYPVHDAEESIPEGWILIETSDDHERGLVPFDYLERISPPPTVKSTPVNSDASKPALQAAPAPSPAPSLKPTHDEPPSASDNVSVSSSSPGSSLTKKNAFAAAMAQKQASTSTSTPSTSSVNNTGKSVVANAFLAAAKKSETSRNSTSTSSNSNTPSISSSTPNSTPLPPAAPQQPSVAPSTAAAKAFIAAAKAIPAPAPVATSTPYARPPMAPTPGPQSTPYASQGSSSSNVLSSPPPSAAAIGTPKTAGFSKLKAAAKSVQSMVHVSSAVATPRVPSLASAVEREDFDELVKRNDEYFARLLSSQADTFTSLTEMVDALAKKLNESTQASGDLVAKLTELDDLIDEEKRKWKLQNENEKNADILERSKELAQAAIRG